MLTNIVSGFPRSGTSMIMEALQAGGVSLVYTNIRDRQMNDGMADEDYKPNPGSLYEIPGPVQQHPGFPQQYFGKGLKVLLPPFGHATMMWLGEYRIIVMKRDMEEVRQSYEAFFSPRGLRWPFKSDAIAQGVFDSGVKLLQARNDTEVLLWNYHEVLSDPLAYFETLDGVDAIAAAAIVDPNLCRFDRKKLIVGA